MEKQPTVDYIERIDVLIKIMAVLIGKDNTIQIKRGVLDEICLSLKQYKYETGGIMGMNKEGVISAFQFDKTLSCNPYEYRPNVDFLSQVINEKWTEQHIEFAGFVHSHLNNDTLSMQDVIYARDILKEKADAERANKISNVEVGLVTEGIVESLKPYGAFVNLGNGLSGLLHISQICNNRIKHPGVVLSEGQTVKVKRKSKKK